MTRYVISDHHFGHANIIEYCDRPFSSVGEMDDVLLDRHYETITGLLDDCPAGSRLRDVGEAREYLVTSD